jgi:RIO kinase 1
MSRLSDTDWNEYYDDLTVEPIRRQRARRRFKTDRNEAISHLAEAGDDSRAGFNPTFTSSRHERQWILTFLGPFFEEQVIADVLHRVKGGKEATVYCCTANPAMGMDLIAAKVYRPRAFRNLRNDAVYRKGREVIGEEGKEVRGRRERLAMQKGTDFGQKLRHTNWLANEYTTLGRLYAAGVDVPKPVATSDNAVLMEFLGDKKNAAPALHQVRLDRDEARSLFDRLLHNIELMLANDRVHADLSAYNVLYWAGQVKIIDWPQAVDPYVNPEAFMLLARDIERVCQYFHRYGIESNPGDLARDLWDRHILHRDWKAQKAGGPL